MKWSILAEMPQILTKQTKFRQFQNVKSKIQKV